MRMRQKPVRPERKSVVNDSVLLGDGDTLARMIDCIDDGVKYSEVYLDLEYTFEGIDGIYLAWEHPESDEEFAIRMKAYGTKLANYNEWYSDNEKEIKEGIEKQGKEDEKKRIKKISKLEAELKKLKKGE